MSVLIDLKEKIIRARLTKKEGEIAEYILNQVNTACFLSASDLAKELNTSNTSVNRMAKALGYGSFGDLQKELQQHVSRQADQSDRYMLPMTRRIEAAGDGTGTNGELIKRQYELISQSLLSVATKNTSDRIDRVVELLARSRCRYISGYRGTAALASKMGFLLHLVIGNVPVIPDGNVNAIEAVMDIGPEDCILVFSFNRYSKSAAEVIEASRQRGARIILITDRATAPFAQFADELLIVDVTSTSYFNSNVAALFLVELICSKLALLLGESARKRLSALEPYINKNQIY
jgi:DNA-binding MurR/RpiR family transcriptional regulator